MYFERMQNSSFDAVLDQTLRFALDYLDGLEERPVGATVDLVELRRRLVKELNDEPMDAEAVVSDLVRDTAGGHLGSQGGRFFAWAIGGSVPAALAADWLTSTWDQNAAVYSCSPAAAVVEEVAGEWIKQVLHLPELASFALVSGCQMAHAVCLAAARHDLLARRGWDVEQQGLSGSPRITVFASNRHGSVERAVRLLGLGEANVIDMPLDVNEQLTPEVLESHFEGREGVPIILVLQAGDLNTGTFDRYQELIPIAKRHGAWVHVDGAFGLWVAASDKYRHLLAGFEAADSWATDGHKWLNVPYDCGYAFVANGDAHTAAMSHRAPYMVHDSEARDQMDWNPEWSRRARGFATYAALRQLGLQGVADLVDRCCRHAADLVAGLGELPGVEVLWKPVINQGLVRFLDPANSSDEAANDRFTDLMSKRLVAHGEAFFINTTWRGRRAMRVSVMNWQTNERDVARSIEAVRACLQVGVGC